MYVTIPTGWKQIQESDFDEYLKTCPDYVRDAYNGSIWYKFRGTNKRFAVVVGPSGNEHDVLFNPDFLK